MNYRIYYEHSTFRSGWYYPDGVYGRIVLWKDTKAINISYSYSEEKSVLKAILRAVNNPAYFYRQDIVLGDITENMQAEVY